MTNDECRAIIQQIVLTGTAAEVDTIDDRMDIAIFRAGMEAAAKVCDEATQTTEMAGAWYAGVMHCALAIREAARE